MDRTYGIAFGTLWAVAHMIRILVQRGLISPKEVDEIYGSLVEGLQGGDPQVAAIIDNELQHRFAELRADAKRLYKGEGH